MFDLFRFVAVSLDPVPRPMPCDEWQEHDEGAYHQHGARSQTIATDVIVPPARRDRSRLLLALLPARDRRSCLPSEVARRGHELGGHRDREVRPEPRPDVAGDPGHDLPRHGRCLGRGPSRPWARPRPPTNPASVTPISAGTSAAVGHDLCKSLGCRVVVTSTKISAGRDRRGVHDLDRNLDGLVATRLW